MNLVYASLVGMSETKVWALFHMGIKAPPARSTLADALNLRDWRIYHALAQRLIARARTVYAQEPTVLELDASVYALDTTTSSLTLAELHRGILEKPPGKKRRELEAWFAGPDGPQILFRGRVLPFDEAAALIWGRLMSEGSATGKPRSFLDMMFAAIAEANSCILVTDNEKHFEGIKLLNPLRTSRHKKA
jgi:toxin FitB